MAPREPDSKYKHYGREEINSTILLYVAWGVLFLSGLTGIAIGLNSISKYIVP